MPVYRKKLDFEGKKVTVRQYEVIQQMRCRRVTTDQFAHMLGISPRGVWRFIGRIKEKFGPESVSTRIRQGFLWTGQTNKKK
jgi:hypothetical protein